MGASIRWADIPKPKLSISKVPKIFTKDQIDMLVAEADTKMKAMIKLAYVGALRVGELARIKVCDLDLENKDLLLFEPEKGGEPLKVPLDNSTISLLKRYLSMRKNLKKDDPLFLSRKGSFYSPTHISREFKNLCKKVGIDGNFHLLRHSRATHLLRDGLGLYEVNRLLRHKRLDTTAIYLHLTNEDLKKRLEDIARGG
jgi:integrase